MGRYEGFVEDYYDTLDPPLLGFHIYNHFGYIRYNMLDILHFMLIRET